ncbi:iron complex transport system permease protein [Acetoanaerobium pronyense]|uniref:Iron complex transport system permease protein n=1 Tax=Acetoanaerobium pronyense TaxID=1482736 RepID=A0ABS4KJD3_9FIRM|nr:iron chelate uptake ABC transporter family permease subunit [Acetoanaerobium pronyense]MBP2027864.1 iron complex transport system permease protein [Acetoanaerobium pronyense]
MSNKNKLFVLLIVFVFLTSLYLTIGLNEANWNYALSRRIPKTIAIIVTAFSIAFSTVVFQTITNNRILTPSVLGLDSLYLLVQTTIVFILGSRTLDIIDARTNFIISILIMMMFSIIIYKFLFKKEGRNIYFLLLVGMVFSTLFQSMSSFMQMLIDPNEFSIVQNNMFASFNNINTNLLGFSSAIFLGSALYSIPHIYKMDVMSLGKEHAINLGIDYNSMVKKMLFVTIVMISVSTALIGPITFLGLLVVNLSREIIDTYEHKYLIIASMIISGISLIGGQLIVERLFNYSTPISVIINLIGGIYFIWLLLKEKKL